MDQPPAGLKGLKALVGILGVLIVLGTALVVGVIIHRLYATTAAPSIAPPGVADATVAGSGPLISATAPLPAGSRILGIAAAADRIAVWVAGPAGDTLWLIDPRTGARSAGLTAPK